MEEEKSLSDLPIGVLDSGIGGLTVLATLMQELPGETFLYYADTANVPYGPKSEKEIEGLLRNAVDALWNRGIKTLVLACNTATSVLVDRLRAELKIPVIGMEPAVKPAVALGRKGPIIILGTATTIRREKFRSLLARFPGAELLPMACPGLVELIEKTPEGSPEIQEYLRRLLEPVKEAPAALVLGCTHYAFVRGLIKERVGENIPILDGHQGTARQTARLLSLAMRHKGPLQAEGRVGWMSSGDLETDGPRLEGIFRQLCDRV